MSIFDEISGAQSFRAGVPVCLEPNLVCQCTQNLQRRFARIQSSLIAKSEKVRFLWLVCSRAVVEKSLVCTLHAFHTDSHECMYGQGKLQPSLPSAARLEFERPARKCHYLAIFIIW